MTAGQRNCYEAMDEQRARYPLTDLLWAMRTHIDEMQGPTSSSPRTKLCEQIYKKMERLGQLIESEAEKSIQQR